jgi:hypothetical protein
MDGFYTNNLTNSEYQSAGGGLNKIELDGGYAICDVGFNIFLEFNITHLRSHISHLILCFARQP